ncbi:acyl-CoA/acyl-ACP dehydrogenase [Streptomyces sp. A7024]|uniref:Acyl-CoA/acyl-ACP dehydrogenase n=1 Tax=Streptomyces coryli TaxID=1128680 RepID=A0A6G4UEB7_9ACTN|nr:acyl-CoA dehydrogenase family protein [Streptomyces coryli]NGN69787.1 acyl-CoA/acyl-ACP dehydrogenase [Streptomyces coryli]
MDTTFTEEQDGIRRTLRELLRKQSAPDDVKAAVRTHLGYDADLWQRLAGDLGLPGLALPEAYGGTGCGSLELALACEETGRAVLPSPLLPTAVLAAPLIEALGTDQQRDRLLRPLAAGERTAALAAPAPLTRALALTSGNDGPWSGGGRAGGVQARRAGRSEAAESEAGKSEAAEAETAMADAGHASTRAATTPWRLYGSCDQVLGGHTTDLLLVAAHTGAYAGSRTLLYAVDATTATGLTRHRRTTLDETRSLARIELRDTPAELIGAPDADVAEALARAGITLAAALAAEAVGVADEALARTVAYVKERQQFGRPVGSFQAVQHRLADLYVEVESARSAAYYAAWAAADPEAPAEDRTTAAPLALAQALEAQHTVTGQAIQLHGGIGFTWEHEAHLFFKRAAADLLLFGPPHRLRAHAAQIAEVLA